MMTFSSEPEYVDELYAEIVDAWIENLRGFHNLVVGANGQRQAMFLENVSGFAERIVRNFALRPTDSALVISSSGCNLVPIEMAECFQKRGLKVVAIISRRHSEASPSKHPQEKKLQDFADLVLNTDAPDGSAWSRNTSASCA